MTRRLLLIPGTPLIVPDFSGDDDTAARLRQRVHDAAGRVMGDAGPAAPRIACTLDDRDRTAHTGSLRAWGPDVRVGGGNHLPELVARHVAAAFGHRGDGIDAATRLPDPLGPDDRPIIAVADGPAALTDRAPLTLLPGAREIDDVCASIAAGEFGEDREPGADPFGAFDPATLEEVGLYTAGMWRELAAFGAALARDAARFTASAWRDSSLGVGYHVAVWEWER